MNLLRAICGADLYDALEPYRVMKDSDMPWAYQFANPNGRPYANDIGIMTDKPWLKALQPWQSVRRMDKARRSPYPFIITEGKKVKNWYPLDPSYPLAPGAVVEVRPYTTVGGTYDIPHVLIDDAVDGGGWTQYQAFIGGWWRNAYRRYSRRVGGHMMKHYRGYKCDTTVDVKPDGTLVSDVSGWICEYSLTFTKILPEAA
jgi:hypothetical protein